MVSWRLNKTLVSSVLAFCLMPACAGVADPLVVERTVSRSELVRNIYLYRPNALTAHYDSFTATLSVPVYNPNYSTPVVDLIAVYTTSGTIMGL